MPLGFALWGNSLFVWGNSLCHGRGVTKWGVGYKTANARRRERGQTLTAFLTSKKAAFAELKKQGLDLLDSKAGRHLLGHLILRQGSFTQDQRQRLKVVTNGSIDYKDIEIAVQKIFGDKLEEHHQEAHQPRRWRSNTYWGDEGEEDFEEDEMTGGVYHEDQGEDDETDDLFSDLICLTEQEEVQLCFYQELPMIMEEAEMLDALACNLEEIFYETRDRLFQKGKSKGKGNKGKKGKGRGDSRTFGMGKGGGHPGGYMAHRKMLQATRNARGYDKPWQQRQGSRMSLNELKSRTRCHQCKQVGHWSEECPHRGKSLSGPKSSPSSAASSVSAMSTGFFLQPPKEVDGRYYMSAQTSIPEEYVVQSPSWSNLVGLSFVYLASSQSDGTALVDTAAQHGLVGQCVLESHEKLLQEKFGLMVQWSNESGGTVRGVCGKEERTKVAYIPIGLGGKSGVLRVQVVPGDIPFLLPAYFLTDLEAVIDMKSCMIMYMSLGVKQKMTRLSTGHVAVSIVEFGRHGFRVPTTFAFSSSQAWSFETVPNWTQFEISHASAPAPMGPVAALCAAALLLQFPANVPNLDGDHQNSTIALCSTVGSSSRTTRTRSIALAPAGASVDCCDLSQHGEAIYQNTGSERRETQAFGLYPRTGQVFGPEAGGITSLHSREGDPRRQQESEFSEMHRLPTGTGHAVGPGWRIASLERDSCIPEAQLPAQEDQQSPAGFRSSVANRNISGHPGHHQQSASNQNSEAQEPSGSISSSSIIGLEHPGRDGGDSRRPTSDGLHWRHRDGQRFTGAGALPGLRAMPDGSSNSPSTSVNEPTGVEVRSDHMCAGAPSFGGSTDHSRQCGSLSSVPELRDDAGARSERECFPVHVPEVQLSGDSHETSGDLCSDGQLQRGVHSCRAPRGVEKLSGWLKNETCTAQWRNENF